MRKTKIKKNPLGDTRTAIRVPDFSEFTNANSSHRREVKTMMGNIAEDISAQGDAHDWENRIGVFSIVSCVRKSRERLTASRMVNGIRCTVAQKDIILMSIVLTM